MSLPFDRRTHPTLPGLGCARWSCCTKPFGCDFVRLHARNVFLRAREASETLDSMTKDEGKRRKRHNRVAAVVAHAPRYAFKRLNRLAEDSGVSKAALSRLLRGDCTPTVRTLMKVSNAVGERLGRRIDPGELISEDGEYPTRFVCTLCGCKGCMPEFAYDSKGVLKPEYENWRPGLWTGDTLERESAVWREVEELE